jgi:hypothetical protein
MTLPLVLVWGAAIGYVLLVRALGARLGAGAPPAPQLVEQVVLLVLWAAGTPAILWSARRFPLDRGRVRHVVMHLALASGFILAINLLAPLLRMVLLGETLNLPGAWRHGSLALVRMYHLALIVYAFILGVGHYLQMLESRRTEELRAERLRTEPRSGIVPVTAHSDQALRAFEDPATSPLAVKSDGRLQLIGQETIDWIAADDDHVVVHANGQSWRARETLRQIERRLDPSRFVRIHRSTLVRLNRVRELQPWFHGDYVAILHTGAKLRVSRTHRDRIAQLLGREL